MKRGIDDVDKYEHDDEVVAQASARRRTEELGERDESMMHTILRTYDIDTLMRAQVFNHYSARGMQGMILSDNDNKRLALIEALVPGNKRVVEACRILTRRIPSGYTEYKNTLEKLANAASESSSKTIQEIAESHTDQTRDNVDLISRAVLGLSRRDWDKSAWGKKFDIHLIVQMLINRDSHLVINSYGDTKYFPDIEKWLRDFVPDAQPPAFPEDYDLIALVLSVVHMYRNSILISGKNVRELIDGCKIVDRCNQRALDDPSVDLVDCEVYMMAICDIVSNQIMFKRTPQYVLTELEEAKNYGTIPTRFMDYLNRKTAKVSVPLWWTSDPEVVGVLVNELTDVRNFGYQLWNDDNVFCAIKQLKSPPLSYAFLLYLYSSGVYDFQLGVRYSIQHVTTFIYGMNYQLKLLRDADSDYWKKFIEPGTDVEWYRSAIKGEQLSRHCHHYIGDRSAAVLVLSATHNFTASSPTRAALMPQFTDERYFSDTSDIPRDQHPLVQYMPLELITPQLVASAVKNSLGHSPVDASVVRDRIVQLLSNMHYQYVEAISENYSQIFLSLFDFQGDNLKGLSGFKLEMWIARRAMSICSNTRFLQSMRTLMRYFVAFKCVLPKYRHTHATERIMYSDKTAARRMCSLALTMFNTAADPQDRLLAGCALMSIENAGNGDWTIVLPKGISTDPNDYRYTPVHGFLVDACSLDIPMDVMSRVVDNAPDTEFMCELLMELLVCEEWARRVKNTDNRDEYCITRQLADLFPGVQTLLPDYVLPLETTQEVISLHLFLDLLRNEPNVPALKDPACIHRLLNAIPRVNSLEPCLMQLVTSCSVDGLIVVYKHLHQQSLQLPDDVIVERGSNLKIRNFWDRLDPNAAASSVVHVPKKHTAMIDMLLSTTSFLEIAQGTLHHMMWNWAFLDNMARHVELKRGARNRLYYTIKQILKQNTNKATSVLIYAALLTRNNFKLNRRQRVCPTWILDASVTYCEEYEILLTGENPMRGVDPAYDTITAPDANLAFNILVACKKHMTQLVTPGNAADKFEASKQFIGVLSSEFGITSSPANNDDSVSWVGPYAFLRYFYAPFTARIQPSPQQFLDVLFQALHQYTTLPDLTKSLTNQALARVLLCCNRAAALEWYIRSNRSSSVQIGQSIIVKGTLPAVTTIVANDFSPVQYQRSFKLSDQWMNTDRAAFGEYVGAAKLYDAGFPTEVQSQYEMKFDPSAIEIEGGVIDTVGRYKPFYNLSNGKERKAFEVGMEYFRGVRRPEEGWMCLYRGSSVEDFAVAVGTKTKVTKPMSTSTRAAIAHHYYSNRFEGVACMMQILVHPDIPLIYLTAINLGEHEIVIHPIPGKVMWLKCVHERAVSDSDIVSASLRVSNSDQNLDTIILRTYLLTTSDVPMVPNQVVEIYHNESFHADAMLPLWKMQSRQPMWKNDRFGELRESLCEWVLGGAQEVVNGLHTTFSNEPEAGVTKDDLPSVREAIEVHNTRMHTGSPMKSGVCFWAPGLTYYLKDERSSADVPIPGYGLFTVPPENFPHPVVPVSIAGNKGYALIQGYTPESFPCIWVLHRPRVLGEFAGRELPAALFTGDHVPPPAYSSEDFKSFELLGRGGYGEVRRRPPGIAVKTSFVRYEEASGDGFRCDYGGCDHDLVLEAHVMSTLSVYRSPYFPVYYGLLNDSNKLYLESSIIKGITIGEYLRVHADDEISQRKILFHLLYALYETRDSQFMHRDLNPNNVIVRQNTGWREDEPQLFAVGNMTFSVPCDTMPVIIDFGLSRINKGNRSFTYSSITRAITLETALSYNIWWEVVGLFRSQGNERGSVPYARGTWFKMTDEEARSEDWTPEKMLLSEKVWKANDVDM